MKSIGFVDAHRTSAGADGGLDALSSQTAAQVKFYANPVGRPDIQRLRGAAHDYRLPLFYATGGYTREATEFADQTGVALFHMDPYGRCTPTSSYAAALVDPGLTEQRWEQLAELQARRYQLAAVIFDEDAVLFARYAQTVRMIPEQWSYYSHVAASFEGVVQSFRAAIGIRDFAQADALFEQIRNRIVFLSWITGPTLMEEHDDLAAAISEGWRADATPRSEMLLARAVLGVKDLRNFLRTEFAVVKDLGDNEIRKMNNHRLFESMVDKETVRAYGMLAAIAEEPTVLSPELLQQLKTSVRQGVMRAHQAAQSATQQLTKRYRVPTLGQTTTVTPNQFTTSMLRVDCLVNRIYRQLEASNQ